VEFDEVADDRETQAEPAEPTPCAAVLLPESFEHVRQEFR
jgi:hypothetical protein